MPPRKTIFTDPDVIVRSLASATDARVAAIKNQLDTIGWHGPGHENGRGWLHAQLPKTREGWIPFDVGRPAQPDSVVKKMQIICKSYAAISRVFRRIG